MRLKLYVLSSGELKENPVPASWTIKDLAKDGEVWLDIEDAGPEELRTFLAPLGLHPLLLDRCAGEKDSPGVISYEEEILLEIPAAFDPAGGDPVYLKLILKSPLMVTIRPCPMPSLDALIGSLIKEKSPVLYYLIQIMYLILDDLADLNVKAQIGMRDKITKMANALVEDPTSIPAADLTKLRQEIDNLVSLTENQLYSIAGLDASDNAALADPHRKAYIQDLMSEAEIAQRSIYRLETRLNDLNAYYQMASSDRVEKRLRTLTIISVITLPLGLVAGLLGMNVGGVPGLADPNGFIIVVASMMVLLFIELWYFKHYGWFD